MPTASANLIENKTSGGIRALAEQLSLSAGTISNVFNRPDVVAEPTRQRVLNAASDLGYVPDRYASALRSRRSKLIGVLVSSMDNPFYVEIAQQVQDTAAEHGYETVLASSGHWNVQREIAAVQYLSSLRVEGIVMVMRAGRKDKRHIQALLNSGCKIVARCEPKYRIEGTSMLHVDIEKGAYKAIKHLLSLGHRRLAVMLQASDSTRLDLALRPKLRGVYKASKEAGLNPDSIKIICYQDEPLIQMRKNVINHLQDQQTRPTAILTNNDTCALAVINAAHCMGIKVPGDISVVGFDNIEISQLYTPALTTVSQTDLNIGKRSLDLLLDQIESPDKKPDEITLEPQLIIRESTGPVQAKAQPAPDSMVVT